MSIYTKELKFSRFEDAVSVSNLMLTREGVAIVPGVSEGNLLTIPVYPRLAESYDAFGVANSHSYITIAIEKRGSRYHFLSASNTWAVTPNLVYYSIQQIRDYIGFWLTQGDAEIQFRVRLQRDSDGRSPHLLDIVIAYTYTGDLLTYLLTIALPQSLQISISLMRDVQVKTEPAFPGVSFAPPIPGFDLSRLSNIRARSRMGGMLVPCTVKQGRIEISKVFPTNMPAGLIFDYSPLVEYIGQTAYQIREVPCIVISDPNEEDNFNNASQVTYAIANKDGSLQIFHSYQYDKTLEIKVVGRDESDVNLIAGNLVGSIKKRGCIRAPAIDQEIPLCVKSGIRSVTGGQIKGELCVKSFDLTMINLLSGNA